MFYLIFIDAQFQIQLRRPNGQADFVILSRKPFVKNIVRSRCLSHFKTGNTAHDFYIKRRFN